MSDLAIAGLSSLTAQDEEQLVTMTVDTQLFGIPILRVQDIVEPQQITPVPLASSAIAGVLNLRGRIVTVIDLRVCLGAEPRDLGDHPMSVTVEHKGDMYTFLVDSIGDVRSLPRRDLDKPPQTLDAKMRRLCSGVFRLQDDLLAVLDVEKVLDPSTIEEAPKRRPLRRTKAKAVAAGGTKKAAKKSADNDDSKPPPAKGGAIKGGSPKNPAASLAKVSDDSLYNRFGGELAVDAAVDMFLDKAADDERLTPFVDDFDRGTLAASMKAFLAQEMGGPKAYKGPGLDKVSKYLVRDNEFDDGHYISFAGHLADCLNQMGLPTELIDEVMTVVENVRDKVMGR